MPTFAWTGRARDGKNTKGTMEAASEAAVVANLRRQGVQANKIKESGKGLNAEINIGFLKPKITTKDIVVFTRQFATMIDAGLPLVQCLDILSSQQDNKTFKDVLLQVKEDVESGATFADALKKHPKVFNELYVNLVAAGEVGTEKKAFQIHHRHQRAVDVGQTEQPGLHARHMHPAGTGHDLLQHRHRRQQFRVTDANVSRNSRQVSVFSLSVIPAMHLIYHTILVIKILALNTIAIDSII